jgi:hypothetical protein
MEKGVTVTWGSDQGIQEHGSPCGEDLIWRPVHTWYSTTMPSKSWQNVENLKFGTSCRTFTHKAESHAAMTPTPPFAVFLSDASTRKTALVSPLVTIPSLLPCHPLLPAQPTIPPPETDALAADLIGPSSVCYKAFPTIIRQTTR